MTPWGFCDIFFGKAEFHLKRLSCATSDINRKSVRDVTPRCTHFLSLSLFYFRPIPCKGELEFSILEGDVNYNF